MTEPKRKVIAKEVGVATVQIRPVGFALYAEEFLIAATSIPEDSRARGNTRFTPVPFYLLGRALELILKSYLLTKGLSEADLAKREFGHDLEALWNKANGTGIDSVVGVLPTHFAEDLVALNAYYKSKNFEYFDFKRWAHGYSGLPPLPRLLEAMQLVVERTKKHVFDVS